MAFNCFVLYVVFRKRLWLCAYDSGYCPHEQFIKQKLQYKQVPKSVNHCLS